nr:MAG TPA: hypothetical protein [Inoviridae sp.]
MLVISPCYAPPSRNGWSGSSALASISRRTG